MSRIKSKYVIKLIGRRVDKETLDQYLLLEFCNGGNLANFLKAKQGFLDEKCAHYILKQLISGIKDHSASGVMHRDLKPENIGIVFDDIIKNDEELK